MDNYTYLERLYAKWKQFVNGTSQLRFMLETRDDIPEESRSWLTDLLDRMEEKKEKYYCRIINELTSLDDTEGEYYEKV